MKKELKYILLLLFSLPLLLVAQELKFSTLAEKEGLSQSVVYTMLQDKYGYMWFGTQDGLNKYDGYDFEVYKYRVDDSASISNSYIWSMLEDSNGDIWVGTGSGLNKYNRITDNFTTFKNNPNKQKTIPNDRIRALLEDKEGFLWLGTDKGLCKFNKSTQEVVQNYFAGDKGLKSDEIISLSSTKSGDILISTFGGGLHIYSTKEDKFTQCLETASNGNPLVPGSNKLYSAYEDDNGIIWIGTNGGGLVEFDRKNNNYTYYLNNYSNESISNNRVTSILKKDDNHLWIGTYGGLNVFDLTTKKFKHFTQNDNNDFSISVNIIRTIYRNKEGIIWLGTEGGGVNIFKKYATRFNHFFKESNRVNSLSHSDVKCFTEISKNELWIGTLGGGINVLNRTTNEYKKYDKDVNNIHDRILSLYKDSDSLIWIGSWGGGVNYYDIKTQKFSQPYDRETPINNTYLSNNNVLDIAEDNNSNIYFATLNGLSSFNKLEEKFNVYFTQDGLSNNMVFSLCFDNKREKLWIGTGDGLAVMDVKSKKINKIIIERDDFTINSIKLDKNNNIWIGSSTGLGHYNPVSNKWKFYYKKDGLADNFINSLLVDDDNNIWVATNDGMSRFQPHAKEKDELFKTYLQIDGLQANEFVQGACFKSETGELFFGGINGFNAFYPNNIINNPHPPQVHLTSFKLFEREVQLDTNISQKKHIVLNYYDNFFSFEFVGLDYVLPAKNMYSWKLEGLDKDWTPPTTRRYASYSNLSGGEYVFKLKASNNDGVWSKTPLSIKITVIPPFWQTTWFYILVGVIGLIIFFTILKIREKQLVKEKRVLEQKVAERTKELKEKNDDILSSIQYAKRIQESFLPPIDTLNSIFENAFILYLPKDIVSGDFYWFGERDGKKVIAAVDCTGHGVPGAFMSMIGNNILDNLIIDRGITQPSEILNNLNTNVVSALKQDQVVENNKDGMDLALITYHPEQNKLEFAGAYRPLYLFKNDELTKIDSNKYPIGGQHYESEKLFTNHEINIEPGDTIYMFSDGYPDQFGGPKGKKFMVKRFQKILVEIKNLPVEEQKYRLQATLNEWKKDIEQVDDILVIGIKF